MKKLTTIATYVLPVCGLMIIFISIGQLSVGGSPVFVMSAIGGFGMIWIGIRKLQSNK